MKNKVSNYLSRAIFFILISALGFSCGTDGDEDTDDDVVPELACNITSFTETYDESSRTFTFAYNENGTLATMEVVTTEEGETETDELILNYTGDVPSSVDYYENGEKFDGTITFTFDGDKLVNYAISYEDEDSGEEVIDEKRFSYTGNTITIVEYESGVADDDEEILEISGENVVSLSQDYSYCDVMVDGTEVCGEATETVTISYDDKLNPLRGNLLLAVWDGDYEIFFSKNNVVTMAYEYEESTETNTYTLEYNSDDFPTLRTDEDGDTVSLTYACN